MKLPFSLIKRRINSEIDIDQLSDYLFQLGHEHEIVDNIFEIEFTPNRGDCLSLNGILRDLGAFCDLKPPNKIYENQIKGLELRFENKIKDKCPKISFLEIEINKEISCYKNELSDYFSSLGTKKNNFFTDVSNYILFETGQPTHCYDASKMSGNLTLEINDKNQNFETLLDKKIILSKDDAVFKLNKNVINLAGVIGGKDTSCSLDTKKVLVECAFFEPDLIIGKSIKYGLNSEAAYRFERGVDPNNHEKVLRRFVEIVSMHTDIKNLSYYTEEHKDFKPQQIKFEIEKINKIIGMSVSEDKAYKILTDLEFKIVNKVINVPSFRSDVKTHNDVSEEISRVIGFNNIIPKTFELTKCDENEDFYKDNAIKRVLIDNGFYEVINFPFTKQETNILVDNPLDSNKKNIRSRLKESLVDNLLFNERRQKDSIKLFEVSNAYRLEDDIKNKRVLGIIASGRIANDYNSFQKKVNKKYIEEILSHFKTLGAISIDEIHRDRLNSKLKEKIYYVEIDIENIIIEDEKKLITNVKKIKDYTYKPISEFPSSTRDLSFSIGDPSKLDSLQKQIFSYKSKILKEVFIFDYFVDHKNKSVKIGFRFIFQSISKTITDFEVDIEIKEIINSALLIETVIVPGLNK